MDDKSIAKSSGHNRAFTRRRFMQTAGVAAAAYMFTPLHAYADEVEKLLAAEQAAAKAADEAALVAHEETIGTLAKPSIDETFYFPSAERDYGLDFHYNDTLFEASAFKYSPELATMSLNVAMSAFNSIGVDYPEKSRNIQRLMKDLDAAHFEVNEAYVKKPTPSSIGIAVGHRDIVVEGKTYTLLITAVRGGGYELEWCGNFLIGTEGDHNGFLAAAEQVVAFQKKYVADQGLTGDMKVWIMGFSRAAATSNLTGALLNKAGKAGNDTLGRDLSGVLGANTTLHQKDAFVYCFEAPAGAFILPGDTPASAFVDHQNIHSIINPCDLVPQVAPKDLSFSRYGSDFILPSPAANWKEYKRARNVMKDTLFALHTDYSKSYTIDDFSRTSLGCGTLDIYVRDVFHLMSKEEIKSRPNYVGKFQDGIIDILQVVMGGVSLPWEKIIKSSFSHINVFELIKKYWSDNSNYDKVKAYFTDCFKKGFVDAGVDISGHEKQIAQIISNLIPMLKNILIHHPMYIAAAIRGGSIVMTAHYPELCLAWMRSMDKNYTPSPMPQASDNGWSGSYRIARFSGDVEIKVFEGLGASSANSTPVAVIAGDEPIDIETSDVVAFVNPDRETLIYLPVEDEYAFEVVAQADTQVSFAVHEFSYSRGCLSRVDWFPEMDAKGTEMFSATVPGYASNHLDDDYNGSTIGYLLVDPSGTVVQGDSATGDSVDDLFYMIDIDVNDGQMGYAYGGGLMVEGTYSLMTAVENEGYVFEGWYVDGAKVTSDPEYRVRAENAFTAVAHFAAEPVVPVDPVEPTKPISKVGDGVLPAAAVAAAGAAAGAAWYAKEKLSEDEG